MHNGVLPDAELMRRVRGGDRSAFDLLYTHHQQRIFAYFWRLSGDESLAADLRQEVFLRLWRVRERWRDGGSVAAYLMRVAHDVMVDTWRRGEVQERLSEQVRQHFRLEVVTPDAILDRNALAVRIQRAVADLPPRAREVFSLKRDAGMSYKEIAAALGISPKTVEIHMGRALSALRAALEDLRPDTGTQGSE